MKVKLTASLSGANGAWSAGDEYICSDEEACSLIEAGFAVPDAAPKVERTVKSVPELRAGTRKKTAP
ncbi:hypothetical protein FHS51_001083 [Sphingobium wenxiniae]|uniref:Uncharacterized protein n=1 Tax=Sphingobium wenxiniae (strain DSM 21828 / CGMCC 1.7748 / JZ-1) TaxID=595605 RepID=A0A562KEH3_SPHWJ|nr:hypothetical protein [Sphingobium wenxiniae]MBB6190863.1 hypothetical protein [Sphingobium wenxiniae]TWH93829.1 hypothetical protein IQ35_02039 [Sphingobium wenxiniae]